MSLFKYIWVLMLITSAVPAIAYDPHKNGNITLEEFAAICMATEGDAQDSAIYETLCELYLAGYSHALQQQTLQQNQHWCFPKQQNWLDEVRWSFTAWYYRNLALKKHNISVGTAKFFSDHFSCD